MTGRGLPVLFVAVAALVGCGLHDPYVRPPQAPAARPQPPQTLSVAAAPDGAEGPKSALARFASAWVNWSAATLPRQRMLLAALASGRLAKELRADASQTVRDRLQEVSAAHSRGRYVGSIPDRRGSAIVLTYEEVAALGGRAQGAYHVYLARSARTAHGWSVTQWQPQSDS